MLDLSKLPEVKNNQQALKLMLGDDFDHCVNHIPDNHVADLHRTKNCVKAGMARLVNDALASGAQMTLVSEAAYAGGDALLNALSDRITDAEAILARTRRDEEFSALQKSPSYNHDGENRLPEVHNVIFGKGQKISNSAPNVNLGGLLKALVLGSNGNTRIQNALAEGTNSAGGYTVPIQLMPGFIDLMRNKSALMSAGAATVLLDSNKVSMASVTADPVPGWRAENAAVSESDITFGQVLFQPKSLAVLVKVSRELLADSINIEEILMHTLAEALAGQLDFAGLYGSGAANQPLGLKSVLTTASRVSALATNGAKLSASGFYKPIMTAAQKVGQANGLANAAVMSARTFYDIQGFADTTGQPLQPPRFISDKVQLLDTNSVSDVLTQGTANAIASEIFTGDFSNLLLGIRQQLEVEVEVLRDVYAGNMQVGFLAHLRADWQVARPTSFWLTQGVLAE